MFNLSVALILCVWNCDKVSSPQKQVLQGLFWGNIINWRFPTICDSFPTRATVMGPFTVGGDVGGVGPGAPRWYLRFVNIPFKGWNWNFFWSIHISNMDHSYIKIATIKHLCMSPHHQWTKKQKNPNCNEGELQEEGLYRVNLIHNWFETSVKKQSTPDVVFLEYLRWTKGSNNPRLPQMELQCDNRWNMW